MPRPSPRSLADALEVALREVADPARAPQERRYLKSSLVHLGRVARWLLPRAGRASALALREAG